MVLKGDLFSKRVSSYMYVCIFCAILNNLARIIYVISANGNHVHHAHEGQQDDMITRKYLSSAKEWTLELFSKRVLSLSWWFCYTFLGQCRSLWSRAFQKQYRRLCGNVYVVDKEWVKCIIRSGKHTWPSAEHNFEHKLILERKWSISS